MMWLRLGARRGWRAPLGAAQGLLVLLSPAQVARQLSGTRRDRVLEAGLRELERADREESAATKRKRRRALLPEDERPAMTHRFNAPGRARTLHAVLSDAMELWDFAPVRGYPFTTTQIQLEEIRMDPRESHAIVFWTAPLLEAALEPVYAQSKSQPDWRSKQIAAAQGQMQRINDGLNARENRFRAWVARRMRFKRCPRIEFRSAHSPESVDEERFPLHTRVAGMLMETRQR